MSNSYSTGLLSSDHDLGWLILTYLRLKETDQFRSSYLAHTTSNLMSSYIEETSTMDFTQDDDYDFSGSLTPNRSNNRLPSYNCNPAAIWRKIEEQINLLEEDSELDVVFVQYNHILDLHIQHDIQLDARCLRSMLYCLKPQIVQGLFNRQLITHKHKRLLGFHFNLDDPFFQPISLRDLVASKDLGDLFITYAVLVNSYIVVNKPGYCSSWQLVQVLKKLGQILNHDRFKVTTSTTKTEPAFKLLVLAAIQNGLFTQTDLAEFLASSSSNSTESAMNVENDDSDEDDSDDSEEDSDDGMDFDQVMRQRAAMRVAGPIQNAAVKKTIGERINVKVDGIFPLSLKNLARIQIKSSLFDYSPSSVRKLTLLPEVLKEFVLFKEENKACTRFASQLKMDN